MAKIEDYLQEEIADAGSAQRARDEKGRFVPSRFEGKTAEEVADSYSELEKLNSRQAQDLGDMRRTVDQLLNLQEQRASSPVPEPTAVPVTVDDLYEDADGVVRRIAREESSSEIKDLKEVINELQMQGKLSELESSYPNWLERSNSPEFTEWASASPYRKRIAMAAAQGDFDAAEEILGMYYDSTATAEVNEEAIVEQTTKLRDAMLETGSPAPTELSETYSRYELMEMRLAAKRGDLKAERYLKSHADAIAQAYAEDRIVD